MSLTAHILFFLLVSLITALVTACIRLDDAGRITRETVRFFATIVVGIFVLCIVVAVLEWIFVRPLVQ